MTVYCLCGAAPIGMLLSNVLCSITTYRLYLATHIVFATPCWQGKCERSDTQIKSEKYC